MKLHIKVTNEDIENGIPKDKCACPIVHAMIRAFPHDRLRPVVSENFLRFSDIFGYPHMQVRTPVEIREFIVDFDSGELVKPFEADLDFEHV